MTILCSIGKTAHVCNIMVGGIIIIPLNDSTHFKCYKSSKNCYSHILRLQYYLKMVFNECTKHENIVFIFVLFFFLI